MALRSPKTRTLTNSRARRRRCAERAEPRGWRTRARGRIEPVPGARVSRPRATRNGGSRASRRSPSARFAPAARRRPTSQVADVCARSGCRASLRRRAGVRQRPLCAGAVDASRPPARASRVGSLADRRSLGRRRRRAASRRASRRSTGSPSSRSTRRSSTTAPYIDLPARTVLEDADPPAVRLDRRDDGRRRWRIRASLVVLGDEQPGVDRRDATPAAGRRTCTSRTP